MIGTDIIESAEDQIRKYLSISDNWTEIAYYGGSFTCLPVVTQQKLYDMAHASGIKKIRFSTSPDCVIDDNMYMAAVNGVTTVEIGVQSLNDEVLRMNNRPCGAEETTEALRTAQRHIKTVGAQIMVGMYGETEDNFHDTVTKIMQLAPEYVRIYPCIVLKDTELENIWKSGGFRPLTLAQSLARAAYAMILFEAAGISVIRIGLQDAEQMKEAIAAGEYHPATGDMAKTIAVAIYLSLGHNITIDKKYTSAAYGYARYNRAACEGKIIHAEGQAPDIKDICRKITESAIEDNQRYIQGQTAFHAERLVGASHHR